MIAKRYEFRGQQLTVNEIAELRGVSRETIKGLIKAGKPLEADVRRWVKRGSPESVAQQ